MALTEEVEMNAEGHLKHQISVSHILIPGTKLLVRPFKIKAALLCYEETLSNKDEISLQDLEINHDQEVICPYAFEAAIFEEIDHHRADMPESGRGIQIKHCGSVFKDKIKFKKRI